MTLDLVTVAPAARRITREGLAVGAIARSADGLDREVGALRSAGVHATGVQADAGRPAELQAILRALARDLGAPHVPVRHAAGITTATPSALAPDQLAADLAASVVGALAAARAVLPAPCCPRRAARDARPGCRHAAVHRRRRACMRPP